jgi:hypothetical protein
LAIVRDEPTLGNPEHDAERLAASGMGVGDCGDMLASRFLGTRSLDSENLPKSNDPALGAIYPIDWHWTTIYVTAVQELASNTLFWGAVVLFLVALIIELRIKLFRE